MLGDVPEHHGVEGRAFCDQIVDLLRAHVEMEHIPRLLRGRWRSLGTADRPAASAHLVEQHARSAADVEHAPGPPSSRSTARIRLSCTKRQEPVHPAAISLRRAVVSARVVAVELGRRRRRDGLREVAAAGISRW